ncbi:MAG: metal-dependent transcriptional regulator [Candidatus Parvarchaeota archaeon]|nr:metal-dependent transcriptional regulator [Candidatus Jingweiarchaeum tengchongense]MCW1298660.1 metal-dependent transcriptional regulator [Candidatus Jingweiarchaeum tengchongense]MCW1300502.1 metal-dependent transcriptional regulator [Candidatus Jingweiarchaeum tengchongense]MCW1304683.1 metal-dependent transcriptional regulator [Candidatus Jingweiarchaeum tengchongense]MCW1305872.1 metal-dependent transcriptional regulator [Candidatus Jingweiarchaeum tengchongense]
MVSVREEDYLKNIYEITKTKKLAKTREIARKMRVSDASVSEIIAKLKEKGLVIKEPYKEIRLTKKGEEIAKDTIKKHETVERFLSDVLKIKRDAHREAEKLEHIISKKSLEKMCVFSDLKNMLLKY